jgi:chromosome segregation protein
MRIKRLEICGFKSFVDRLAFTFPDPVTAVVGPNGCGKSNIVDAIRWVMGEQSAKHLRGRAMDDVIFAGSESRGPAGMAEVSLSFDARGMPGTAEAGGVRWGAAGPEEVVVTRRLYRGGESEYLLGGVPCRLRDIVDFFLGTGVGSKAYAIIEQGRIGFIVSSRPEDRRTLIDEAAGITRYKARKKVAERRMEATRQHLLRVSDIIGEIETRLRSLRLQAQKAERYKRYKAELKDLELWSAAQRFLGYWAEEKALEAEQAGVAEVHRAQATTLRAEELSVEAERLGVTEEMVELAAAKDELFALSNKAQLGCQRAQHHEDESAALADQAALGRRELEDLAARATENFRAATDLDSQLTTLDGEADERGRAYRELEAVHGERRAALAATRLTLDELAAAAATALARLARLESEIEGAHARREDLAQRIAAASTEIADLGAAALTSGVQAAGITERLVALASHRDELDARRGETEGRAAVLRAEVARGEMEIETLREEAHRRRSRLQSLAEIQARYESFERGVRAIMQRAREPGQDTVGEARPWSMATGVRGVVADIVQAPPELETAVEAVLGDRLGNIIVESQEVGVEAVEFLKARSEGRSSFIPVGLRGSPVQGSAPGTVVYDVTGGQQIEPSARPQAALWPSGDGVCGPMLELIGYDREYDQVAAHLLGDVLVVEDLRRALALWHQGGIEKTIVTLEGEVIDQHGVVTGGSRESAVAGVLSQKREIRELEEVVARLESDYQAALDRHLRAKQSLADVSARGEEIAAALRRDEMDRVALDKDLDSTLRERRQHEVRRDQLAAVLAELRASDEQNEQRMRDAEESFAGEEVTARSAQEQAAELRTLGQSLAEGVDALVAELTTLKIAASQADERRRTARETLERLGRERADQDLRRARLEVSVAQEADRAEVLRGDASRLREQAGLWQAEADERARAHAERQGATEERQAELSRREAELRAARARVEQLARELGSLELRCQEARLRRSSLEEHIAGRYRQVSLSEVVHDYHLRPPAGEEQEARMNELRGLIERMGEINLTAIEESADLQKRFDFLTAQKADLESAIAQLETAIEKINRASRKRFREVFEAVNSKFQEVFPRLFGGGRAYLQLTDESDLLETGVEIVANPPGKKVMQNIELLSGGEKALTAVALLFAIFLIKPSPFCVLDEVDAPLDEANVGRFNEAVRDMTNRSQFILITHNRRTMEISDRLCGITMEEPGVSKLVAVNLRNVRKDPRPPVASDPASSENQAEARSAASQG